MRIFGRLLVVGIILVGVYWFYVKKMPTSDPGTSATQAISLTGVRSDLLQLAQAERSYVALNGKCTSVEELVSSGDLMMAREGRDGYTYQVSCSGSDFQIVAEHPPADPNSGIRYPKLAVDSTMLVREVQ